MVAIYTRKSQKSPQIYKVHNPFDFMDNLSIEGKTNFFEKKVSEYQKMGVISTEAEREFRLDADFWLDWRVRNGKRKCMAFIFNLFILDHIFEFRYSIKHNQFL